MEDLVRRARGMLGVGLTWGTCWGAIGAAIGVGVGIVSPWVWQATNPILEWAVGMGLYGLVSGAGFAGLLSLREARKSVGDLNLSRVAAWGVLGSAMVPLLFGAVGTFEAGTTVADVLGAVGVTAILGGTFASGSVAMAKRAALLEGRGGPLLQGPDAEDP